MKGLQAGTLIKAGLKNNNKTNIRVTVRNP